MTRETFTLTTSSIAACRNSRRTENCWGRSGLWATTRARSPAPSIIAVDHDGVIYVVDAAFQNVQMFDSQFQAAVVFRQPR